MWHALETFVVAASMSELVSMSDMMVGDLQKRQPKVLDIMRWHSKVLRSYQWHQRSGLEARIVGSVRQEIASRRFSIWLPGVNGRKTEEKRKRPGRWIALATQWSRLGLLTPHSPLPDFPLLFWSLPSPQKTNTLKQGVPEEKRKKNGRENGSSYFSNFQVHD